MTIWGCAGNAATTSAVSVDVVHPYIGDISLVLKSPDGTWYNLSPGNGSSTDNIDRTFTVNLSSEAANGTWRLEVRDNSPMDIGFLSRWSLDLGSVSPPSCGRTSDTDVPVADLSIGESPIAVSGCTGNASGAATVAVNIQHPYVGDLNLSLVAPDGTVYHLRERSGSTSDNVIRTFTVNLSAETRAGTWRLRMQDHRRVDVGYINSWNLNL